MERLDRKDLKDAPFDVTLRGYDRHQVDERIRLLGNELTAAENALRATRSRAEALEAELHQARAQAASSAGKESDGGFGARVEKILVLAREEAREVREQAAAEASRLVEEARAQEQEQLRRAEQQIAARQAESEKAVTAAAQEVRRLREAAAREAQEMRQAATREAEQLRKAARAEAAQLVEEARAEADRMVAVATEAAGRIEHASNQQVARLTQLRDQINTELGRAKHALDQFFAPPAADPAGKPGHIGPGQPAAARPQAGRESPAQGVR